MQFFQTLKMYLVNFLFTNYCFWKCTVIWPYYDFFAPVAAAGPAPPDDGGGAGGVLEDAGDAFREEGQEDSEQSSSSTGTQIRSEFPETWLWADHIVE